MAASRIRTIKPSFWTDSTIVQLPHLARLLYIGIWNFADDEGAIEDDPVTIQLLVLPRERRAHVEQALDLLIAAGRITRYEKEDGTTYLLVEHFKDHQKVQHPTASKIIEKGARKRAIPNHIRTGVAEKYGCPPGGKATAHCFYCGAKGSIHWWKNYEGEVTTWVIFPDLELDHFEPESLGGAMSVDNFVLACRRCNRSKGNRAFAEHSENLMRSHDGSLLKGREGRGRGEEGKIDPRRRPSRARTHGTTEPALTAPAAHTASPNGRRPWTDDDEEDQQ